MLPFDPLSNSVVNTFPMRKLIISALASIILLFVVSSPVTTIWLIKWQADRIVSDSLRGLTASSLAGMNVSEGFLELALALNATNTTEMHRHLEGIQVTGKKVDAQYEEYQTTLNSPAESAAFAHLVTCRKAYRESRHYAIQLLEQGKKGAAMQLFQNECMPKFQAYEDSLSFILQSNVVEAGEKGHSIMRLCYFVLGLQVVLFGFFFIYAFFVPLVALLERLTRRPVVSPT